jgi:hypothetical protein
VLLVPDDFRAEPPLDPAAERRAEVFAAFTPARAPLDAALVVRLAAEAARFAVLRGPELAFFVPLRAVDLRAEVFFAELFLAEVLFAGELFFAELFLAEVFFAELFLAEVFFAGELFFAELFLAEVFFAELFLAEVFFAADLRPELFFVELLVPDDVAASTTSSTADTAAPAAASAASAARLAAVFAADATLDAVDEDCLRFRVVAAFLPAALRLVLLERELLLRAGAI